MAIDLYVMSGMVVEFRKMTSHIPLGAKLTALGAVGGNLSKYSRQRIYAKQVLLG